jgi:cation diffusion facilitator CzcD-associated flavoprotein CzcO
MTNQHIETLVIGAGQAGLSTGYHLRPSPDTSATSSASST